MAVLSVTRVLDNGSDRSMDEQGRVTRGASEKYDVQFTDDSGTPRQAETASAGGTSIPALGDSLNGDSTRRVTRVSAVQNPGSKRLYHVTVTYSTRAFDQTEIENPLDRPAEIVWDFEESREVKYIDMAGIPVQNSAHLPYDPPPDFDISDPVVTFTRNYASFPVAQAVDYKDAVNNDTFTIGGVTIEPGWAKVRGITGAKQYENGTAYWRVTIRIAFRPYLDNSFSSIVDDAGAAISGDISAWYVPVKDMGLRRLDPNPSGPQGEFGTIPITDSSGQKVTEPQPLNGLGQPLTTGNAVFRLIQPFRWKAFASLNLT